MKSSNCTEPDGPSRRSQRRLVGLMLDGSHHAGGEHDERDVTMPAVPGSGIVVVEPELVFGCLEAILDRPAVSYLEAHP